MYMYSGTSRELIATEMAEILAMRLWNYGGHMWLKKYKSRKMYIPRTAQLDKIQ